MSSLQEVERRAPSTTSGVLLTTADRQIEAMLGNENVGSSFSDSLYQSIIFYEGVVVPDILAFISTELNQAAGGQNVDDFSAALKEGLVTPAFRRDAKSFVEALAVAREQKIKGIQPNAPALAIQLDEVWCNSKNAAPQREWARTSSKSYAVQILKALENVTGVNQQSPRRHANLSLTANFIAKHNMIGAIKEKIEEKEGELLRGDLFQLVMDKLNEIQESGHSVFEDSSSLLSHPATKSNVTVKAAVRSFVTIGNLIYHANMASSVRAQNYLPGHMYTADQFGAIDTVLAAGEPGQEPNGASADVETHEFTAQIPSLAKLQTIGLSRLIAIRRNHQSGYFSYLKAWQSGSISAEDVQDSLAEYCRNIHLDLKPEATLAKVLMRRRTGTERAGLGALGGIGTDLLKVSEDPILGPTLNLFTLYLGPAASLIYSWQTRPATVQHSRQIDTVV